MQCACTLFSAAYTDWSLNAWVGKDVMSLCDRQIIKILCSNLS